MALRPTEAEQLYIVKYVKAVRDTLSACPL